MILILEDNQDKVGNFLIKQEGIKEPMIWFQRQLEAQEFVEIYNGQIQLVLDEELWPGCGSGHQFLEWVIEKHKNKIKSVIVNTFSITMRKVMAEMVNKAQIPLMSL